MRTHDEILLYGLRIGTKNELVHIDVAENGKQCNCECPYCGAPLVARNQGEGGKYRQNIHHFAHDRGYEPCGQGGMTALHIMAQNILAEEKKVMLPKYTKEYVQHPATLQAFEEVRLEEVCKNENSTRRPDCNCLSYNNSSLWVEVFCTNSIYGERERDIIRRKQYCIEIDFSDLLDTDYTKESIRERLLTKSDDRKWICHPEWDEEERKKEEEAKIKQEEERKQQEEERRKKQEQARLQWAERMHQLEASLRKQEEDKRRQEETLRQQEEQRRKEAEKYREGIPTSESSANFYHKDVKAPEIQRTPTDWVMYAKVVYSEKDALKIFYDILQKDYTKVCLAHSHPLVQEELYLKVNELLPRTHLIVEVTKTYLQLLLAIWVLDKLNHSQEQKLGKVFVENQEVRNAVFKAVKKIENINPREISESLIPNDTENRDIVLQILRICYTKINTTSI